MSRRVWRSANAQLLMDQTRQPDPVSAVTTVARQLLDDASFNGPPFDPEILASMVNVSEVRRVSMTSAARLIPAGDSFMIEVNSDHPRGKQNFSIDHEVVHTLMPTYAGQSIDDEFTGNFPFDEEEEALCDIGASVLLLDSRHLRPRAEQLGLSVETLGTCAQDFDASLEATAYAIAALDLCGFAFVFWEPGYRKSQNVRPEQTMFVGAGFEAPSEKYRVARAYVSPSFRWFIAKNKSVPDTSCIARCGNDSPMTNGEEQLDLGSDTIELRISCSYVPYRTESTLRSRVVSLLLPTSLPTTSVPCQAETQPPLMRSWNG